MASKEADSGVKNEILKSFVDREKTKAELAKTRGEHAASAAEMLNSFWGQFDMDDIDQRVNDYQKKSGSGFRVHFSGLTFIPGGYRYPFVDVEDKKLGLREIVEGEGRRDPAGSGKVMEYKLVVADEDIESPEERDRETGDIAGEAVFATVPIDGSLITYPDEDINADINLAEAADREVLGHLRAVQEGMLEMLGNPAPVAPVAS